MIPNALYNTLFGAFPNDFFISGTISNSIRITWVYIQLSSYYVSLNPILFVLRESYIQFYSYYVSLYPILFVLRESIKHATCVSKSVRHLTEYLIVFRRENALKRLDWFWWWSHIILNFICLQLWNITTPYASYLYIWI